MGHGVGDGNACPRGQTRAEEPASRDVSCHPPEKLRRGDPALAVFNQWGLMGKIWHAKSPARSEVPFPDPLPELVSVYTACDKLLRTPDYCCLSFLMFS